MNGIKFIREKSNFSRNALADRMGVTRQTVTLWERGVRRPDKKHLKWLCDFYGIEEKWFGDLSDEDMLILKEKKMLYLCFTLVINYNSSLVLYQSLNLK